MTIAELKRAIDDANLPDDAETNIADVLIKRGEWDRFQVELKEQYYSLPDAED